MDVLDFTMGYLPSCREQIRLSKDDQTRLDFMNSILCLIDFSNASLNAFSFAIKIAAAHRAALLLYYVHDEVQLSDGGKEEMKLIPSEGELEYRLKTLFDTMSETERTEIRKYSYHVEYGEFPNQLIQFLSKNPVDAIVMGSDRNEGTAQVYAGGKTIKMMDKSLCRVFVIPESAEFKGFNKIVYATNFQESDRLILQEVIALAVVFKARVKVLHITNNTEREKVANEAYVNDLSSFVQYDRIDFVSKSKDDKEIDSSIEAFLSEEEASLLVLLTRNHSFLENLFRVSVTQNLSYTSDCPILVLKSE